MYQKIIIAGNLGRDPEMRYMPDGTAVTSFSVATNRKWTNRQTGEPQEETLWFRVSVWGRQGEVANQYLSKGRQVLVEGTLQGDAATGGPRLWTRQDGSAGASFDIRADTVRFIGGRDDNFSSSGGDSSVVPYGGDGAAEEEDDIPF